MRKTFIPLEISPHKLKSVNSVTVKFSMIMFFKIIVANILLAKVTENTTNDSLTFSLHIMRLLVYVINLCVHLAGQSPKEL